MTQSNAPVDRRTGLDRRRTAPPPDEHVRRTSPIAEWALVVPAELIGARFSDPWARVVHESIVATSAGRHGDAAAAWEPEPAWHVSGLDPTRGPALAGTARIRAPGSARPATPVGGPLAGPAAVRAYHKDLARLTAGTFRQELVSVEGARGPLVDVHVRTTARRAGRALDLPHLLVFELRSLRIRHVTELPGDLEAWSAFWRPVTRRATS